MSVGRIGSTEKQAREHAAGLASSSSGGGFAMSRRTMLMGTAALIGMRGAAFAQPVDGGDLVIGQASSPDFLDAMVSTAQSSRNINLQIYEMLVSRDEHINPKPDIADSWTESDDGLTYTFKLRPDVRFHNGKAMTADDVKASIERYARIGTDRVSLQKMTSAEATDPSTVTVKLSERLPSFIEQISSPRAPLVVIPAEDKDKGKGETSKIGTGPYQFVEWVQDSHVTLKRFADYVPNPKFDGTDGLTGKKVAHFDTVTFRVIPEAGARVSALETGEIHISEDIPHQAAVRLANSDVVRVAKLLPWSMLGSVVNCAKSPTDNLDVRRAIQIGINAEEIMAIATDGVYRLDYGLNYPESQYWAGDVGRDLYNQANVDKARELLKKSGYGGEELVILANSQSDENKQSAVVLNQQLADIGFKVRIDAPDFPTGQARRKDPKAWNIFMNGWGLAPWLGPYGIVSFWTGGDAWQNHPDQQLEDLATKLSTSPKLEDRVKAAADFQSRLYDQVYWLRYGDDGIEQAVRSDVQGFTPFRIPRAWNIWRSA